MYKLQWTNKEILNLAAKVKNVSNAIHGFDKITIKITSEFSPQHTDVNIHGICRTTNISIPNTFKNFRSGYNPAWILEKISQ